jgi:hypothetical protein
MCRNVGFWSCSLHYFKYQEQNTNSKVTWLGLILWEIGLLGSTLLLDWSGFIGGTGLLDKVPIPQIHESIVRYVYPIGINIVGFLISIINIYATLIRKAG